MHYYKRNLGDYAKKAGRLSMLQHGAYTLLIDACYDREQFPTMEEAIDWTWASSAGEIEAVEFVLRKFFVLEDGHYVQKRIQEEIEAYHSKSELNTRIALERESKRKAKSTNRARTVNDTSPSPHAAPPPEHEAPPNQEPLTKNQEPTYSVADATAGEAGAGAGAGDGDGGGKGQGEPKPVDELTKTELWASGKSLLEAAGVPPKQCGSFVGKLIKDYTEAVVVEAVRATVVARPADPAEYLKAACQRMVGLRAPALNTETAHGRKMREAAQGLAPGVARRTGLPTAPPIPVYEMEAHRAALPAGH